MGILPYRDVEAGVLGERHASDLKQVRVKRQKSKTASPSLLLGLQGPKEEEKKKKRQGAEWRAHRETVPSAQTRQLSSWTQGIARVVPEPLLPGSILG